MQNARADEKRTEKCDRPGYAHIGSAKRSGCRGALRRRYWMINRISECTGGGMIEKAALMLIAFLHRLGRLASRSGNQIDADDGVVRFR